MKKPLVQLFGIAFTVAVLATGVFYGLVANKLSRVEASSRPESAGVLESGQARRGRPGRGIPRGMRVISTHVADSAGVLAMLAPGDRVDVQAVGGSGFDTRIATILQNVQVLSVEAPAEGRSVVNLIVNAQEAALVGLADSTSRVRLTLRSNGDDAREAAHVVTSADMFRAPAPAR
jgi:Flp pilus assembly protein CpaB